MTACDRCRSESSLTNDGLRVAGWQVYDGQSFTGQPLRVRICPRCQTLPAKSATRSRKKAPRAARLF
jgi:hypothetical protein